MLRDLALIFIGIIGGAAITHVLHFLKREEEAAKPKVGGGPGEGGEGP